MARSTALKPMDPLALINFLSPESSNPNVLVTQPWPLTSSLTSISASESVEAIEGTDTRAVSFVLTTLAHPVNNPKHAEATIENFLIYFPSDPVSL